MNQWEIFPLTHTLEPFSKPGALRIISVHPHILSQVEDLDLLSQNRSLQTCSYNMLLGAFRNNRESLLKVTSKCYSDAIKGKVRASTWSWSRKSLRDLSTASMANLLCIAASSHIMRLVCLSVRYRISYY